MGAPQVIRAIINGADNASSPALPSPGAQQINKSWITLINPYAYADLDLELDCHLQRGSESDATGYTYNL